MEYILLKPDCHSWWISRMQSDTLEERYAIKLCFKLGKMPQKHMEYVRLLLEHLAWIEHEFLSGIRDSRKAESLWGMMKGVGVVRKSIHQSWVTKGLGLGLLCWGFKKSKKRFLGKRPALFKSSQGHFHQDNARVHISILVRDYLTKMGIKTVPHPPYSPDLAPFDFWLFPKLRDNWGDERGCDEGHWHAHTRGLPWGLPEVVGTAQVHYSRRCPLLIDTEKEIISA